MKAPVATKMATYATQPAIDREAIRLILSGVPFQQAYLTAMGIEPKSSTLAFRVVGEKRSAL